MKSSQSTFFFSYWYSRSATETVNVQVTIIWKVKLVSTYLKDTQSMFCWIIFSFLPSALYFSMESKYICKCKHLLNTFRTILFRKWPNMFLLYIGWNLPLFSNPRAGPGFLKGGANPKGGGKPNIWPNVPGNCMKKKNSDQRAKFYYVDPPLKSRVDYSWFIPRIYFSVAFKILNSSNNT